LGSSSRVRGLVPARERASAFENLLHVLDRARARFWMAANGSIFGWRAASLLDAKPFGFGWRSGSPLR
jgi:hypothetical protein